MISLLEAGSMEVFITTFSVRRAIDELCTTMAPLARPNRNRLKVSVAKDVGFMDSDPGKLRQILVNLLGNAMKFTEDGVVSIDVARDEDHYLFVVSDTGVGISPEHIRQVFEPFTQVDSSQTRRVGGTGLGLTLCVRFCEMLGGTIELESEVGVGSMFTVRLPILHKNSVKDE